MSDAWIPLSTVVAGGIWSGGPMRQTCPAPEEALLAHAPAAELGDRISTTTPQAARSQVAPGCA
jgi:hypothetical protein